MRIAGGVPAAHHGRPELRIATWLKFARAYQKTPAVKVSYPDWVLRREYRDRAAECFGLENRDLGRDNLSHWGGGSSFDGMAYRGRASEMAVFDRWPYLLELPEFYGLLAGEPMTELLDVGTSLFGHLMPVDRGFRALASLRRQWLSK